MTRKPKDHSVAQRYLKRWTVCDGPIHVYDKKINKSFPASICNVAYERGFDKLDSDVAERLELNPDVFANRMTPVEQRAAVTIDHILRFIDHGDIGSPSKAAVAECVAFQQLRTPSKRKVLSECFKREEKRRSELGKHIISPTLMDCMVRGNGADAVPHSRLFDPFPDYQGQTGLQHHSNILCEKFLHLIGDSSENGSLYTSDDPVVRIDHGRDYVFGDFYFPLTPRYCLLLVDTQRHVVPSSWFDFMVLPMHSDAVKDFNRLQVKYSSRQIFSANEDFGLAKECLRNRPEWGTDALQESMIADLLAASRPNIESN